MNEQTDLICALEDALQELEVLTDSHDPAPHLAREQERLESRLDHLQDLTPAFARPA